MTAVWLSQLSPNDPWEQHNDHGMCTLPHLLTNNATKDRTSQFPGVLHEKQW